MKIDMGSSEDVILYADFAKLDSLYLPAQLLTVSSTGERKFTLFEQMTDDDIRNVSGNFKLFVHDKEVYNKAAERLERLGKKLEDKIIPLFSPTYLTIAMKLKRLFGYSIRNYF